MFALLISTGATLAYLCAVAGFLIILASVIFVVKGKAVLSESGAPNVVEWGKIKANLTSAVALFALGAVLIGLPFWRFQEAEARQQEQNARQPATAILKGKIIGDRDVRLLLVVKPDYDQTYRGDVVWEIPLLANKASYSVFYVDGDTIFGQQPFSIDGAALGPSPQKVVLPDLNLQTRNSVAQEISPKLDVSDAELKKLGIH
jgi:hypothetical protein